MQLTEVEAAFRTLKSALAIRPLFHQLEKLVKAHVLVAFLGYALQVTLKHLLKQSSSEYSPAEALKQDEQQKILYVQVQWPELLEPTQILKCSGNSAIA
jgi:transposase